MKLTLRLITLLVALGSAHPDKKGAKQKPARHSWDYKFEYLKAKNTLHYLQRSQSPNPSLYQSHVSRPQKRDAPYDPTPNLNAQDEAPTFLPPPWSPFSELDSPYPQGGVTPWDDSGRAEILDNEPSVQMWRTCPELLLDCRKCPRDSRCRRPGFPWWSPTDVLDVPDALTGPQIAGTDDPSDGKGACPLGTCSSTDSCGENARCVRNHCVCEVGFKGAEQYGPMVRGFDGLQALTVWVDRGVACDVPCDTLACAEVEQVKACFGSAPGTKEKEYWGHEEPETDDVSSGAINLPIAAMGEGGDYVGDVAASGSYGVVK